MMPKTIHILIVNNYTGRGGIPKAVAGLANQMAQMGHRISVISQKPVPKWLHPLYLVAHKLNELSLAPGRRAPLPLGKDALAHIYPLHPSVTVIPYSFSDNNLKIQKLRKELKELNPDVCVCPLPDGSHMVWAATLLGTGIPYVYSERTSPQAIETVFWNRRGRLAAMSGADAIHLLTPEFAESIPPFLRDRVHVIPNAVKISGRKANPAGFPQKRKRLLWLGRLFEEAKQCRLAIDAFAMLMADFPDWEMRIVGTGPDFALIKRHCRQHDFGHRVYFTGESNQPEKEYLDSQLFCLSSRLEGMPNTLLEAMAAGLPCVAFSQCPGVSSIIRANETGLLAAEMTAEALAQKLRMLMFDSELRNCMGSKAREAMEAHSQEKVYRAWEELLINTAAKKGATALDSFNQEPFASMARLAHKNMQEWASRDFGQPMPGSFEAKFNYFFRYLKKF